MATDATYPVLDVVTVSEDAGRMASGMGPAGFPRRPSALPRIVLWDLTILVCLLHGWAIWAGLGGREGLTNGWPPWRDDHPLYFHSALVTRDFLKQTGTTAGYDPAFMAGYAKSIVFPASSTLPELVMAVAGGSRPDLVYKLYVLISAASVPWLVLLAARGMGATIGGALLSVILYLTYLWSDFPINYAAFGMLPYLVAIPLGLVASAAVAGYAARGGFGRWVAAGGLSGLCVLVHFTAAMVVVPAAATAYVAGVVRARREGTRCGVGRHLGIWMVPAVVLGLNAFWWWPGLALAATKGESGFAFAHSEEDISQRLAQIFTVEPTMQGVLLGLGLLGLVAAIRRRPVAGLALLAFAGAGGFWGYFAALFPGLDFLQPGRHTYALYTGLAVAAGVGWGEVCRVLAGAGGGAGRLDLWATTALAVVGLRVVAPNLDASVSAHLGQSTPAFNRLIAQGKRLPPFRARREPFLSSRPSPRLLWVVDRVSTHVRPGERLLYEEGGKALADEPEPFDGGRFSGLLPWKCGVEVIGGPYLHAALTTNFTQFGEGTLFGKARWDRGHFVAYANLYRPAAIVCWTEWARSFCKTNPDLIEIKEDDGRLLIGRVKGFEGDAIRGKATVEARPGRLTVAGVEAGVDGLAVLRYHSVPCLRSDPEGAWEPVSIAGDPVPFIGVRPTDRPIVLELAFPVRTTGGPR